MWLRLAGCQKVFHVSSYKGEGVAELLEYLKEDGDVLPWEEAKAMDDSYSNSKGSL
jgi:ethanolamine utilization protein EutP